MENVSILQPVTSSLPNMAGPPSHQDTHVWTREDNGDLYFTMSNFHAESMKTTHTMRNHQMLTDVVIEAKNEKFHAHRVVLASGSPYFRAMFTGGLKETDMSKINIRGVCPAALRQILDFMYTGTLRISGATACALLEDATMLQVPDIIAACCLFFEKKIQPSNVIGICIFAKRHGCKGLYFKARRYIEQHFEQVSRVEEFFHLTAVQLVKFVRSDTLNVLEERVVYNAVVDWIKFDEEKRQSRMEYVLHAVRCQYLPPNFLRDQVDNCALVKKSPQCRKYLADIFQHLTLHKKPFQKARTPNTPRILYVVGGYSKHSLDTVEALNIDENTWISLNKLSVPRSGLGGALLKGMFYAIGGRSFSRINSFLNQQGGDMNREPDATLDTDWVERYNPGLDQWKSCSPMSVARYRLGVAVLDGLVYAVGGCSGETYHKSVESYDPDTDQWKKVRPMHHVRMGVGVVVVNRLLYAIGGFDGENRLNSIECYNPENDAWTLLSPMQFARSGIGVGALDNYVYVVGGFDGETPLNVVERFNIDTLNWERVKNLNKARSAFSLTELDGKLYAMGGYDGTEIVKSVEVYDPVLDHWSSGVPFINGRSGHASAVSYHQCMLPCNYHEVGSDPPRTALACCPADRPPRFAEKDSNVRWTNADSLGADALREELVRECLLREDDSF